MTQKEISALTDRQLHESCRTCGSNIRKLQKEFAGYLHEVACRRLHRTYGFYSLYEYAAKLAGMSHAVVDEIMDLHKKLEDKPVLKDLIVEQGWTKLKIVAGAATGETQVFWAEKVRQMSKSALETYVKELRKQGEAGGAQIGGVVNTTRPGAGADGAKMDARTGAQPELFTEAVDVSVLSPGICTPADVSQKGAITFRLNAETETKLRIFKQRHEKQTGELQDWDSVMKQLLKIAEEHGQCGKRAGCAGTGKASKPPPTAGAARKPKPKAVADPKPPPTNEEIQKSLPAVSTRHIPARVKKYLVRVYEGKCAYPGCRKAAQILHHTRRFALNPSHDPDFMVPLCKAHESLAHQGLIQNEESAPDKWAVGLACATISAKSRIDAKVNGYRKPDG